MLHSTVAPGTVATRASHDCQQEVGGRVRQLCDVVEIGTGSAHPTIRVHMQLSGAGVGPTR